MSKSRLTTGVYVFTTACLLATWAYSQGPKSLRNPAPANSVSSVDPFGPAASPKSPNDAFGLNPAAKPKSSRIMFDANWKNVQVGSKPMYFQQGAKAFVWTVKNTGDNPIEVGDDYGFSIAPGEEDFIVDTRLVLSVANDTTTTVEVNASRVMTRSELTGGQGPTPAAVPTYAPVPQSSASFKSL